jgi:hypothetical protein
MSLVAAVVGIAAGTIAVKNLKDLGAAGLLATATAGVKAARKSASDRIKVIQETGDQKVKELGIKSVLEGCSNEDKAEILAILQKKNAQVDDN